jgi:5-methylcytosine-specific restriction protein B
MEKNELWQEFLNRWPIQTIKDMTLEQYIALGNKDTFIYWLEYKTIMLGSIKGGDSSKFGIYLRRGEPKGEKKHVTHGKIYTWVKRFGDSEQEAFSNIKLLILSVIQNVKNGDLSRIENNDLTDVLKAYFRDGQS